MNLWRLWKRSGHADRPRLSEAQRYHLSLEILEARCLLSFTSAVNYPVIESPVIMAVGDFNGDGIPDLAVNNDIPGGNGAVSVLLGNGDGTFRGAVSYLTGGSIPSGLVAGDFNGDGILDLVVVNGNSNSLGILLGNGDGTFQSPTTIGGFSGPAFIAAGDFNGDGNLDLAVTNRSSNTVSVLLGNGDGTFQPRVNYQVFSGPREIIAADLNGDGFLDLVVAPNNGINVMVLLGNGDGTFQDPTSTFAGQPADMAAGDFNGDGHLDLAVTNRNNANVVSVLLGNGDGTFQPVHTYPVGTSGGNPEVAVADFNHDGILDLAATNSGSNTVSVLLGNGDGTFQAPRNSTVGSGPRAVIAADLNGDGSFPDLAVDNDGPNNPDNDVSILLNDESWGTEPKSPAKQAFANPAPAADALPRAGVLGQPFVSSFPSTIFGNLQPATYHLPPLMPSGTPALAAMPDEAQWLRLATPATADEAASLTQRQVSTLGGESRRVAHLSLDWALLRSLDDSADWTQGN